MYQLGIVEAYTGPALTSLHVSLGMRINDLIA